MIKQAAVQPEGGKAPKKQADFEEEKNKSTYFNIC